MASGLANTPYTPYTGQRVAGQNEMNPYAGQLNPYASNRFADQQVQQLGQDTRDNYMNGVAPGMMAQF